MSPTRAPQPSVRSRLWIGFFAPGFAWFAFQQGLGAVERVACGHAGPPYGVLVGLAALLICLAAAQTARRDRGRRAETEAAPASRFIRRVTIGMAAIFGLAIAYQTAAVLLVPSCVR